MTITTLDNKKKAGWRDTLTQRDQQEVSLAELYAENYQHGTSGHLSYMLIAQLATRLDNMVEASAMLKPTPVDMVEMAFELYTAYGRSTGFLNYQGNPMPSWADLTPAIRAAWEAAAQGAIRFIHFGE